MSHATSPVAGVGPLLRSWRERRRRSQLDLATEAEVSTRHLSFVETGRSTPSRELLLHLAEHLDVPLRERNELLLAAGYAPTYPTSDIHSEEMRPVREALELMLEGHMPRPALVFDGGWDLVLANDAAAVFLEGVAPEVLEPVPNVLRLTLHPRGMAPRIVNLESVRAHLLQRVRRQLLTTADPRLEQLLAEVEAYPGDGGAGAGEPLDHIGVLPVVIQGDDGPVSYLSTVASFGSPTDVVVSELTIELFFPVDGPVPG